MSIRSRRNVRLATSSNTPLYTQAFRRHVHQLVFMGYQRLDPPTFRNREEPEISGELARAILEARDAEDAPRWASRYTVHDDPPQHAKDRFGKERRRVDIALERVGRGRRPRFQFEAKRLHAGSSVGQYLGSSGLGCFLTGDYAAENPMAGMLGYVQAGDEGTWASRIKARMHKSPGQYRLRPDGPWTKIRLAAGLKHTYETRHDRQHPLSPVLISHVLLRFH